MIRIAAVGDIHVSESSRGKWRPHFAALEKRADVLLIAGDLTNFGRLIEAEVLAEELQGIAVPVVAVFGNHDHHSGQAAGIRSILETAGLTLLEGESITVTIDGRTLGIAGQKGFGGGFEGAHGHKFGEPEMKAYVQAADDAGRALEAQLKALQTDYRIALLHYAPVRDTVAGEDPEIFPFLGSYQLEVALDRAGADLALHGHAHHGRYEGTTKGGIPVRNVALPLIGRPYVVFTFDEGMKEE
jgi:Icc-related predicted phosphoesterase